MSTSQWAGLPMERVTYIATFPKSKQPTAPPRYVEIDQTQGEHDLVRIVYGGHADRWYQTLGSGAPVSLDWKITRGPGKFVGYVSHVRPTTDPTLKNPMEVLAIATSYDFRDTGQKVWRNRTAPEVASEIAKQFGFKAHIKQHGLRYPNISQAGHSYWELLRRLAQETGHILKAEGNNLLFLPLDDYITANVAKAPVLVYKDRYYENWLSARTVESFVPLSGDHTEGEHPNERYAVVSVDPKTAKVQAYSESPGGTSLRSKRITTKYQHYLPHAVAHKPGDARLRAKGQAEQGRMGLRARATLAGDPRIQPYRPVYVDVGDDPSTGWWIVRDVRHQIHGDGRYFCECVLTTDGIGHSAIPAPGEFANRDLNAETVSGISDQDLVDSALLDVEPSLVSGMAGYGNGSTYRWAAAR